MNELRRILESILFVSDEPINVGILAQVTEEPKDVVESELRALAEDLQAQGRGVALREVSGGWRMYSHPDASAYVERFVRSVQQPRLTQAALETLAIVAYKQPVTRQQIAAIRGVESDGVVGTLEQRGLVMEVGRDPGPGQAVFYGTSPQFLERLGLPSLEALPAIAPLLPPASAADELEP
ncbi:MAG: SMC-Scp complex subunit ScpB [Actinobacteria bacterium]|nr:MAG: SMC-Scp complex subunit ScpB [Actinomycetota bacterium]